MKLTARDQDQQNALANAFHDRERFTLTGAGLQAEFVAEVLNRVPCVFGSGRYETNLELVQVTEATTQAAWNGEGLPPVGTVCEYQTWVNREWKQTKVLAHHLGFAVHSWSVDGDDMEVDSAPPQDFRPIRTPEQIAEEDRDRAIEEMREIITADDLKGFGITMQLGAIYDAGYRKV